MKRTVTIVSVSLLLVSLLFFSLTQVLAANPIVKPGSTLFPFQQFAEKTHAWLLFSANARLDYQMKLVDRRSNDAILLAGSNHELDGIQAMDDQLNLLMKALAEVKDTKYQQVLQPLLDLLDRIAFAFGSLKDLPDKHPSEFQFFSKKLDLLRAMVETNKPAPDQLILLANTHLSDVSGTDNSAIPLPGQSNFTHTSRFRLTGKHAVLECSSCHKGNVYTGNPTNCITCHTEDAPSNHFTMNCAECHDTNGWQTGGFLHPAALTQECASCHEKLRPDNHFTGDCSTCHTPKGWATVAFNHQTGDATDCASCHEAVRPANHYTGQCSACHTPTAWANAVFNHQVANAIDCQSCHEQLRPASHFPGQCSSCHTPTAWANATFNHQAAGATDCQSCHNNQRPANHYTGQCSACHTPTAWRNAVFNHQAAGATNCQSCHNNQRPANHFSGQCSLCHTPTSWANAVFNHQAVGATDCVSCHINRRPANHFDGQCSTCHTTSAWLPANFNHTFPMNHHGANGVCATCHPSGPPAWTCFNCHNQNQIVRKHENTDVLGKCMNCHADGRKPND